VPAVRQQVRPVKIMKTWMILNELTEK
jgi:hypothetical protein